MLHAIFLNISFLSVWVTFLATLPVNVNSFITVYVLVDCCTSLRTEVVMRGNCCFSIKWFTVIECLLSVPCGSVTWNQKVIRWPYRFLPSTQWPPNTNHYKNSQYSICLHYDTYFLNCRVINDPSTCIKHLGNNWGQPHISVETLHEWQRQRTLVLSYWNLKCSDTAIRERCSISCGNYTDAVEVELCYE